VDGGAVAVRFPVIRMLSPLSPWTESRIIIVYHLEIVRLREVISVAVLLFFVLKTERAPSSLTNTGTKVILVRMF